MPEATGERTCSRRGDFVEDKFGVSMTTASVRVFHHLLGGHFYDTSNVRAVTEDLEALSI